MKRKAESFLWQWKEKSGRKPLLLTGSRQTGKTYLVRDFSSRAFSDNLYLNLEMDSRARDVFSSSVDPDVIIRNLGIIYGKRFEDDRTVLILDEVQSSENAITSLKYFAEKMPSVPVIATGSLLGVAINRENYSFPVGKVDEMRLYPMSFEEFLIASGKEDLVSEMTLSYEKMTPIDSVLHDLAVTLYRDYLLVGGMPETVAVYIDGGCSDYSASRKIQGEIINGYLNDMARYMARSEAVNARACYNSLPVQLGKDNRKFQYKLAKRGGTAAIFGSSIEWLRQAGIVLPCVKLTEPETPLKAHEDIASFKLYASDPGLLCCMSNLSAETITSGIGNTFIGAVTENYIASEFTASGHDLHYWESDGKAEIDFIIEHGSAVIPVEVKSSDNVRSRSLSVYREKYNPGECIRLSLKNFGYENGIRSVPLYAAFLV